MKFVEFIDEDVLCYNGACMCKCTSSETLFKESNIPNVAHMYSYMYMCLHQHTQGYNKYPGGKIVSIMQKNIIPTLCQYSVNKYQTKSAHSSQTRFSKSPLKHRGQLIMLNDTQVELQYYSKGVICSTELFNHFDNAYHNNVNMIQEVYKSF